MKKIFVFFVTAVLAFSFAACQKKEEKASSPRPAATGPIIDKPAGGSGFPAEEKDFQVVVPDAVKNGWTAVVIAVDEKATGKTEEFKVKTGGEFSIPNSKLTVKVGPFLPSLKITGNVITSESNEPNNPSVAIAVYESGKRIFPAEKKEWGWLYANLPQIHAFEHERYGLKLIQGIKK
ncbi:MAG: DUF2155 domain-containing protein [Nitrospirae bacterium]|nr:DUF2155 domain-containing protein [Nitrospirota bacterium]